MTSLQKQIAACASALLGMALTLIVLNPEPVANLFAPDAYAIEGNENQNNENQGGDDNNENPPEEQQEETGNDGGSGARRGHEVARLKHIARYVLKQIYGFDPEDIVPHNGARLREWEEKFLCSMKRVHVENASATREWFPQELATLLGLPLDTVMDALLDPELCPDEIRNGWIG